MAPGRLIAFAAAVTATAGAILVSACATETPATHAELLTSRGSGGWDRLQAPPALRYGAAAAWTGSSLVLWGGCSPRSHSGCSATTSGFEFLPDDERWHRLPAAPLAAGHSLATWTGDEITFVAFGGHAARDGLAFNPETRTWRKIAPAPMRIGIDAASVWDGSELIVWGGHGGSTATRGAAYDPETDEWRAIASSPVGLNAINTVWTGKEAIFFGSLLDSRNVAASRTAVGAAYDPASDSWRRLPRSSLSPQASTTAWLDGRMVAWDYIPRSQEYDPEANAWTQRARLPLQFSECYPDSAVVDGRVFGFYCGSAALYEVGSSEWTRVHGGPLRKEVKTGAGDVKLWRFSDLVEAGRALFVLAGGISGGRGGEACYGCSDSPVSFWVYQPREVLE